MAKLDSQAYNVPGAGKIKCENCGTMNAKAAKKCFKCGAELTKKD